MSSNEWERHEFILTLDLYHNQDIVIDASDPQVREVAKLIGRTPESVVLRLANYTHLDPAGTQGMSNTGRACQEIWEEYYGNEEELRREAERIGEEIREQIQTSDGLAEDSDVTTGEYQTSVSARRGATDFRAVIRQRFNDKCILCDVSEPGLLQAAHILSWSEYPECRGAANNGLLLCYLHHKAFDIKAFTIDSTHHLWINPSFEVQSRFISRTLADRDGQRLAYNGGEPPSPDYLSEHNDRLYWWPLLDEEG